MGVGMVGICRWPFGAERCGKGGFDQPGTRGRVSWEEELTLVSQAC